MTKLEWNVDHPSRQTNTNDHCVKDGFHCISRVIIYFFSSSIYTLSWLLPNFTTELYDCCQRYDRCLFNQKLRNYMQSQSYLCVQITEFETWKSLVFTEFNKVLMVIIINIFIFIFLLEVKCIKFSVDFISISFSNKSIWCISDLVIDRARFSYRLISANMINWSQFHWLWIFVFFIH